ncbi:hypothetical protein ABZZ80_40750 [Streptomyces sp. NPDC006356]
MVVGERVAFDLTFDAAGIWANNICRVRESGAASVAADPEAARCACWDAAVE